MPYAITRWNVQQYVEMDLRAWNDAYVENWPGNEWIRVDHIVKKAVQAGAYPGTLVDFLESLV